MSCPCPRRNRWSSFFKKLGMFLKNTLLARGAHRLNVRQSYSPIDSIRHQVNVDPGIVQFLKKIEYSSYRQRGSFF